MAKFVKSGWLPPQPELLLHAALGDHDGAILAWEKFLVDSGLDGLDEATQALLPLVYRNLSRHGCTDSLMEQLAVCYRQAKCRNEALFEEMALVIRCFHSAGIPTMLLKGAALSISGYLDRGARPMRVFDVLVPSSAAGRALHLLENQEWRCPDGSPMRITTTQQRYRPAMEIVSPTGHLLNLHWHLLNQSRSARADAGFWQRAWPVSLGEDRMLRLPPTDQLLDVCAGGIESREPIGWVCDAMLTIRAGQIDWERLLVLAQQHDAVLPLRDALHYLRNSFQAPIPRSIVWRLEKVRVSRCALMEYRRLVEPGLAHSPLVKLVATYRGYLRGVRDWPVLRRLAGFLPYLAFLFRSPVTRPMSSTGR